jgi:hypothetical protein
MLCIGHNETLGMHGLQGPAKLLLMCWSLFTAGTHSRPNFAVLSLLAYSAIQTFTILKKLHHSQESIILGILHI